MSKGGKRNNAGRPKGSLTKVTAELKAIAQKYTPEALKELMRLAKEAESEAVRVSAIKELLDRGHGKSAQPVTGEGGEGPVGIDAAIEVSFVGTAKTDKG